MNITEHHITKVAYMITYGLTPTEIHAELVGDLNEEEILLTLKAAEVYLNAEKN